MTNKPELTLLKELIFPMAGITRCGYDRDTLEAGQRVKLVLEPTNPHDPNAIRVEDLDGKQIAYVPAPRAKVLAPKLVLKKFPYKARLVLVPDGDLTVWGVHLRLYAPLET